MKGPKQSITADECTLNVDIDAAYISSRRNVDT